MRTILRKASAALRHDERGATMVEYGLIAALVALAMAGGLGALGGNVLGFWQTVDEAVESAN